MNSEPENIQQEDILAEDKAEPTGSLATESNKNRSSKKELEERIEFTAYLLGQMFPKGKIKKILKDRYQIGARCCESYLALARAKLVEWSGKPKEEHHLESVSFYMTIIQSPTAPLHEKMTARQRLDALFGLEPPKEHKVVGDRNSPIVITLQDYVMARERAQRWRYERFGSDAGGNPDPVAIERQE